MKNKPILRWVLIGLIHLIMSLLGFIIVPFLYKIRDVIRTNDIRFFWLFLNDTIKTNEKDIDWGDYGRYSHSFWGFYRQNAVRNSHWNFRLNYFIPKQGKEILIKNKKTYIYNIFTGKELSNPLMMCNIDNYWGFQNVIYEINGIKYFRFSLSKPIGNRVFNVQFGSNSKRYIYKIRFSNLKQIL